MYTKLNTALETRNILGLSDADLQQSVLDPYYEYIQVGKVSEGGLEAEKAGQLFELELPELNIKTYYTAILEPNPALHKFGSVSYTGVLGSGKQVPTIVVRAYGKGEVGLDWIARIRLLKG